MVKAGEKRSARAQHLHRYGEARSEHEGRSGDLLHLQLRLYRFFMDHATCRTTCRCTAAGGRGAASSGHHLFAHTSPYGAIPKASPTRTAGRRHLVAQPACCALRRRMCFVLGRREVYGAMPRSRDPGYVRVPDTNNSRAGASSPEPSEARKAAMLWFLTFSMVDGMMPYVGSVSTPALQFLACQTSKSVADKWSLAELLVVYTPRRRAVRRSGGGACKCALVGSARCMAGGVGGGHVEVAGRTSPRLCWLARASSVQTASGPCTSSFASASATARPASSAVSNVPTPLRLPRFTPPGL